MIISGRQRSTIEIQTPPAPAYYQAPGAWVKLYKMKAEKIYTTGNESTENSGITETEKISFKIRFRKNITADCRIIEGATVYDIKAIQNIKEKNKALVITCAYNSRI